MQAVPGEATPLVLICANRVEKVQDPNATPQVYSQICQASLFVDRKGVLDMSLTPGSDQTMLIRGPYIASSLVNPSMPRLTCSRDLESEVAWKLCRHTARSSEDIVLV